MRDTQEQRKGFTWEDAGEVLKEVRDVPASTRTAVGSNTCRHVTRVKRSGGQFVRAYMSSSAQMGDFGRPCAKSAPNTPKTKVHEFRSLPPASTPSRPLYHTLPVRGMMKPPSVSPALHPISCALLQFHTSPSQSLRHLFIALHHGYQSQAQALYASRYQR